MRTAASPRPSFHWFGLLTAGLLTLGCQGDKPSKPSTETTASSATPGAAGASAEAPALPPGASLGMGKMMHCPSSVEGAMTAIKDVEGGVEVTVTAKGDDAVKEIRARGQFLAGKAKDTDPSKSEHTGTCQGGGALGRCPVVMKDTTVESNDVEGGSRITVKPRSAAELDWLRREARERNVKLSEPGAVNTESGKRGTRPEASPEVK